MGKQKKEVNPESTKRLQECLANSGHNIKEIADMAGYQRQTISNYFNGQYALSIEAAHKLGKVFGVTPEYLLDESDYKTRAEQLRHQYDQIGNAADALDDYTSNAVMSLLELNDIEFQGVVCRFGTGKHEQEYISRLLFEPYADMPEPFNDDLESYDTYRPCVVLLQFQGRPGGPAPDDTCVIPYDEFMILVYEMIDYFKLRISAWSSGITRTKRSRAGSQYLAEHFALPESPHYTPEGVTRQIAANKIQQKKENNSASTPKRTQL